MKSIARLFAAVGSVGSIGLAACLLSCGGGSTASIPQADACNQASRSICARVFSCTDTVLLLAQVALGGSEAACQTTIQASYCGSFQCTGSQTYHGDKAQQCKDQFTTVSCMTLATAASTGAVAGALMTVPACQQVCTGGDASTSGG
jgi:hypothetical protein